MTDVTTPSPRLTNRQAVHANLRQRIITLQILPGSSLSENELAAELNVSRTPVREVLILLADEGLVEVFPQIGTFVSLVDPQRVRDAQFLREAVEVTALRDVPSTPDLAVLEDLAANIAAQQIDGIDTDTFFRLDEEFHQLLLALSGHRGVWPSVVSAKAHLDRARRLGLHLVRPASTMVAQHATILNSVQSGDHQAAAGHMRTHLRTVLEDVDLIERERPELFAPAGSRTPVRRSITSWE